MGWQPDEGGHWLLVEHLGVKRALEFLLRKEIVSAEEAAELGLVNEVVPDGELMARTMQLATELAEGPQVAMRLLKRATYNAAALTFDQAGDDIASKTAISDFHLDAEDGAPGFLRAAPGRVQPVAGRRRGDRRRAPLTNPTYPSAGDRPPGHDLAERDVAVGGRLSGHPEETFADDVALHLVGAAGDRDRAG